MAEPDGGHHCRDPRRHKHGSKRPFPSRIKLDHSASSCSYVEASSARSRASSPLPPSALRRGKFSAPSGRTRAGAIRPLRDLGIVRDVFGEDATLYRALRVQRTADAAVIRRAYVSRGREALFDAGFARPPRDLNDVPKGTRRKFLAVSIAYEILSIPELRSNYDRDGVVHARPADTTEAKTVRWKSHVEERVIVDSHPDEHSHATEPTDASPIQWEERGWIESYIQSLDEEADIFFREDFLDGIDETLTNMQSSLASLVGSMKCIGYSQGINNKIADASLDKGEGFIPIESGRGEKSWVMNVLSALLSPCSITLFCQCMEDITNKLCACDLPFDLLGRDDEMTAYNDLKI